ncbi:hypothetical protein L1987_19734 [Smallanthus sonchifolius]|uniref:Uncharacterized protein n=1 Tax=Smallanthus sonchifolius TaxID=185202 RepID=A0ACB9IRY2_9ASTR|nr:hypothetical protein L1987_19734 [Smallanthus sonchifolius]
MNVIMGLIKTKTALQILYVLFSQPVDESDDERSTSQNSESEDMEMFEKQEFMHGLREEDTIERIYEGIKEIEEGEIHELPLIHADEVVMESEGKETPCGDQD